MSHVSEEGRLAGSNRSGQPCCEHGISRIATQFGAVHLKSMHSAAFSFPIMIFFFFFFFFFFVDTLGNKCLQEEEERHKCQSFLSENPSRVAAVALWRFVFSSHRRSRGQDALRHAAAPRSSSNTGTTQQKKKEEWTGKTKKKNEYVQQRRRWRRRKKKL